jgi:hypothetical protein
MRTSSVLPLVLPLLLVACGGQEVHYGPRVDTPEATKRPPADDRDHRVFAALIAGEDAATAAADQKYPDPPPGAPAATFQIWATKHQGHYLALRQSSRARIAKQFQVTEEDLDRIAVQGAKEFWPPLKAPPRR